MSLTSSTVEVDIKVQTGNSGQAIRSFTNELGNLSNAVKKTNSAADSMIPSIGRLSAGVFVGNLAFHAMTAALRLAHKGLTEIETAISESVHAAMEQVKANDALRVSLANVGEGSSGLYQKIQALSSEIQSYTGIADDVIAKQAGLLVSFGATGANISRVTKAAIDLSAAMGKDLESATFLLGKAMQGQFTTLKRFGIVVDEGASSAHKLEQALSIIEARFGGAAAAQVQNYAGKLSILREMFGELKEAIGNSVVLNADFINALDSMKGTVVGSTESVNAMAETWRTFTSDVLLALIGQLPNVIELLSALALTMADIGVAVSTVLSPVLSLIELLGGLIATIKALIDVWLIWQGSLLISASIQAVSVALVAYESSMAVAAFVTGTATAANYSFATSLLVMMVPMGRLLVGLGLLGYGMYQLGKSYGLISPATKGANDETSKFRQGLAELRDKALGAADALEQTARASRQVHDDLETGLSTLQATQERMQELWNSSQSGTLTPEAEQELEGLKAKYNEIWNAMQSIIDQAPALKLALDPTQAQALADLGFKNAVPEPKKGFRTPDATEKDPKAEALKSLKEEIEATKLENEVRREGIQLGQDTAKTDILVTEGKNTVKTGSRELAQQLTEQQMKLIDVKKASDDLKAIQDILYQNPRDVAAIQNTIDALTGLNSLTVTELDLKKAEAVAQAKSLQGNLEASAAKAKLTVEQYKEKLALELTTKATVDYQVAQIEAGKAEDARINKSLPLKQQEYDLLMKVYDGTISMEQATILLSKAEAEAAGSNGDLAAQYAATGIVIDKLRKKIEDTTIDLGKSFDNIADGIVDGLLQGTNKGLNVLDIFKRSGQAIFGDMLKGMVKDKLGFDLKFSANFLRDLPGIVSSGMGLIKSIFSGGMNSLGSGFGGLLTAAGGVFGPDSTFGAILSGAGQAIGGNGGGSGTSAASQVSSAGTILGILKNGYAALNTMMNGGTLAQGVNALTGGITGPLMSGLSSLTGGIAGLTSSLPAAGTIDAAMFAIENAGTLAQLGQAGVAAGTGANAVNGAGQVISGTSAGLSLTGAATTFGIIEAVVAAVEANMAMANIFENRKGAFGNGGIREMFMQGFDPLTKFIANFTAIMSSGQTANNQLGGLQRIYFGGASGMDYTKMAAALTSPLMGMLWPLFIMAGFMKPVTGGTAERVAFEGFLEDKGRKHESRRFAPYFGNVPVMQDGQWVTGDFQRGIGQEGTRKIMAEKPGTDFVDAMRQYIDLQGKSMGLTEEQINQFRGLGVAFRASLGAKAGDETQRSLAPIADLLGSMAASGADVATSMGLIRLEIAKLGDPSKVFKTLNDFFQSDNNDIAVEDYRAAIMGLAQALFAIQGTPNLKFDLTAKNEKGLAVAQETLDAINSILKEVPHGVKVVNVAMDLLNETFVNGEQGVVTFEALSQAIQDAVDSANLINPEVLNFFNAVSGQATAAIKAGTENALIDSSIQAFTETLGRQIQKMVSESIVNGFLDASVDTGILAPFNKRIRDASDKYATSGHTNDDLKSYIAEIRSAGLDAVAAIKEMAPALREFASVALDIGSAFDAALLAETATSAVDLAKAIYALNEAQKAWNNELDARIFALENKGAQSPDIISRGLPDIQKEMDLARLFISGSISDVVAAVNKGLISEAEMPKFLRGPAGLVSDQEKMAALVHLRELTEKDLSVRIAAIQARANAEIQAHSDRIDALQVERDNIQENYAAMIDAKQAELDLIKEQIDLATKWQDVLDKAKDTILQMQTGSDSPVNPRGRISILQDEFNRQKAIFASGTASDAEKQKAAAKITEIGPQLLTLLQEGGFSQSSEAYAAFFDQIIATLSQMEEYAAQQVDKATGGKTIEELQARGNDLTEDIKNLNQEQKAALKNIDASIKAQQKAIVDVQNRAEKDIEAVSKNTAETLKWIKEQGNKVFAAQTDKLRDKLKDLGVDSANLFDVQTDSWLELIAIRRILEGEGIKVTTEKPGSGGDMPPVSAPGMFGITSGSQEELRTQLPKYGKDGNTVNLLKSIQFWSHDQLQAVIGTGKGPVYDMIKTIYGLFPATANSGVFFSTVISAILDKIADHGKFNPVLGFARGGIVTKPTYAVIGEGREAEAVLPLSRLRSLVADVAAPQSKGAADLPRNLQELLRSSQRAQATFGTIADRLNLLNSISNRDALTSRLIYKEIDDLGKLQADVRRGFEKEFDALKSSFEKVNPPSNDRRSPGKSPLDQAAVVIENLTINNDAHADITAEGGFKLDADGFRELQPLLRAWLLNALNDPDVELKLKQTAQATIARAVRSS